MFQSLMERRTLADLNYEAALEYLASLIDTSLDVRREEGLRHAIALAGELSSQDLTQVDRATLHYFLGNAWSNLGRVRRSESADAWMWQQEEFEREIIHFRLASRGEGFTSLPRERRCQILTNLGNVMSEIGRFVEAVEYLSQALEIDSNFAMAQGNRGMVLTRYARTLYDPGHQVVFIEQALEDLRAALRQPLHADAHAVFEERRQWVERVLEGRSDRAADLHAHPLGKSKAETAYRRWCLEHRLFVNPLNDLGPYPIAAHDVLTTPSIVVGLDEGPYYPGFFNQMKQEFVSARYLYYGGVTAEGPHFSDRGVLLYNTLDYPAYSLAVEKVKAGFRTTYALLDKIAYFLNHYLRLEIPETRVTFKTFWHQAQERTRGLRAEFARRENWPLRGLFWLSKDLYEPTPGFKESVEPDAEQLADIRNHLEHKYLKLHDMLVPSAVLPVSLADSLAFSVERQEFERKALRLLKMVRAGLIYLSLAVQAEERSRAATREDRLVMPMFLDSWEDDWKM